jgi:hypothetical protein
MKLLAAASEGNFDLGNPGDPFSPIVGLRVQDWIRFGVRALLIIGLVGFFIYLLVGAVQWILSGGDKEGVEKAKKKITQSMIGLAILLSAFAIIYLVGVIFKTDLTKFEIPTL